MFTKSRHENLIGAAPVVSASRPLSHLIFAASAMIGSAALMGCGQKGDLYLVEPGSQTVKDSTSILDSSSQPQDAAFAKIDDDQDNIADSEDFQLPEPSSDPNDY